MYASQPSPRARQRARLIRSIPVANEARETLQALQGVWDTLSLLCELSATGVEISGIRQGFEQLASRLVEEIASQAEHKAELEQAAKAQVAIDILTRNLFERTADIGFLATDAELRRFALAHEEERVALAPALRRRLLEYQRKYTVYDDIVLLAPDGRVLARLDESVGAERTGDQALLERALTTREPYVEVYRAFDMRPQQARSLVYACRVTQPEAAVPVAVLCLCFRLDDECERIFQRFVDVNDWSVVAMLDAEGRVLASSDATQVPVGAQVAPAAGQPGECGTRTMRFAGRQWLAATCRAHAFQGYAGPGWRGHTMTPLDNAFEDAADGELEDTSAARLAALRESRVLYPEALREIAGRARGIELDLARAVWNGNLAAGSPGEAAGAGAGAGTSDAASHRFSRSLLREIGRTGTRMSQGFTAALAQMSRLVAAAKLADAARRATLVCDILDRSLYERANDCRWWALAPDFVAGLQAPEPNARGLRRVLQSIHALYTVYANLVVFDRQGSIVAASRQDEASVPGQRLQAEWVARTLALPETQSYCVSAFEPSELYGGRPTYVYCAAVRAPGDAGRVLGGIAIVFDSEPQLCSMLQDTLPRDGKGLPIEGAFSVFIDSQSRVIACSHATPAVGEHLTLASGADGARLVSSGGRWYTLGEARSSGYREFKGPQDPYREEVSALVLEPMTEPGVAASSSQHALAEIAWLADPRRMPVGRDAVDLATFAVAGSWYAMSSADIVQAIACDGLVPLHGSPQHVLGTVVYAGRAIAVLDGRGLLGTAEAAPTPGLLVVLRSSEGDVCGALLVDELGTQLSVERSQLVQLPAGSWHRGRGAVLIDSVVSPPAGQRSGELLTMLSAGGLQTLLRS